MKIYRIEHFHSSHTTEACKFHETFSQGWTFEVIKIYELWKLFNKLRKHMSEVINSWYANITDTLNILLL